MAIYNELLISTRDAEMLAGVVGERRASALEAEAAHALADLLIDAPMVTHERLPDDRVAMNTRVTYREEPGGACRTIVVVHPSEASPADRRISVLSPVGRSLLGRRAGSSASIAIPGGRALTVRILEVERTRPELAREAA